MYNLCCISLALKKKKVKHRALRYTQFEKHERSDALEILGERALENLQTTLESMRYARKNNWGYRISSTIFPLFNLEKANVGLDDLPNVQDIQDKFAEIRQFVKRNIPYHFRISFHPDHFNVLCSANPDVVERTIKELDHHAWLMDEMAGEESRSYWYPLNIHMSRSAGKPQDIAREFIKNYKRLPERVQKRLVLENEDKGVWSPDMLYNLIYQEIGVPITYDTLHHRCNPGEWSTQEAYEKCIDTWRAQNTQQPIIPLFHYSEGGANGNPRAHTDFAESTPKLWREKHDTEETSRYKIDWDIELKQKDYAIQHLEELEQKKVLVHI